MGGALNMNPAFEAVFWWAAVSGMIGAVVITVIMYLLKATGQDLDFPYLLGTYFVDITNTTKVYTVGIVLNIIFGGIWGIIYVVTIVGLAFQPEWEVGILWGFAHGIIVGVIMSTITQSHPHMGEGKDIPDPGILGSNWSDAMPYLILGIHVIFGVVTLFVYQLFFEGVY